MRKIIFLMLVFLFILTGGCETSSIKQEVLLYENTNVGESDGHYVSPDFATPSTNSTNIKVYFDNQGDSNVTVTLEKKGLLESWTKVDAFIVEAGEKLEQKMEGASKTTYRMKVDSSIGAKIKGHLKAERL